MAKAQLKCGLDSLIARELDQKMTISVDASIFNPNAELTNELIDIGFDKFYEDAYDFFKELYKLTKKTNFDKPAEKSLADKIMGIHLIMSGNPRLRLYTLLKAENIKEKLQELIRRLEEIETKYSEMIQSGRINKLNAFNATALLAEIEGLKKFKMSVIELENSYEFVIKNHNYRQFYFYWDRYYNHPHLYFYPKCKVNDVGYLLSGYTEQIKVGDSDIFGLYNEIKRYINYIRKHHRSLSIHYRSHLTYAFLYLKSFIYDNNVIERMGIVLDNLRSHIEKEKGTLDETEYNNRLRAIDIFKSELAPLKEEILEVTAMKDVIKKAKKDNSYHEAGYFDMFYGQLPEYNPENKER